MEEIMAITQELESGVVSTTTVKNVHDFVDLPGTGRVYRGTISITQLARLIKSGTIKYAPQYQRGFRKPKDDPSEYEALRPLTDTAQQIKVARAQEMAVKYLSGRLYSAGIIWNARREPGEPDPTWDVRTHDLLINTEITVPDTAHRHLNYFLLARWKREPEAIPQTVIVNEKPVLKAEIQEHLEHFDPNKALVFLEIYNLSEEHEGWLYDQFNNEAKKPDRAVGIQLNRQKTPSRRFLDTLMKTSPIFSETEVETRSNSIGSESRKLTTISTLAAAAEQDNFKKLLINLEDDSNGPTAYMDLVHFFSDFFAEYAKVFPAFVPGSSVEERKKFRDESFALSNIMFHPLFKIAKDLWLTYRGKKLNWREQPEWRRAIARFDTQVPGPDGRRVSVMSRENPAWLGKIAIEVYGPSGATGKTSLSNTRQTRDAAYQYLLEVSDLNSFIVREPAKNSR
jgi:hypothetical protein